MPLKLPRVLGPRVQLYGSDDRTTSVVPMEFARRPQQALPGWRGQVSPSQVILVRLARERGRFLSALDIEFSCCAALARGEWGEGQAC